MIYQFKIINTYTVPNCVNGSKGYLKTDGLTIGNKMTRKANIKFFCMHCMQLNYWKQLLQNTFCIDDKF